MNKKEKITWIIIIAIGVLFFFVLGEKGPVLCKDSPQYLQYNDFNSVMPLYPLFISLHHFIFGETIYLNAVFVTQGILALISCILLTAYIQKEFEVGCIAKAIIFVMSLLPYAYTLPEHVSSHEIMTESLAFPLFYIFVIILLYGIIQSKYIYIFVDLLPLFALIMLRSHLLFLAAFYFLVICYILIKERNYFVNHKKTIIGIIIGIVFISSCFFIWRQASRSRSDENSPQIVNALFGKALYIMDDDDIILFHDEDMRTISERLFNAVDKKHQRLEYAKKGLLKWEDITYGFNDDMKIGNDVIYDYYRETSPELSYEEKINLVEIAKTEIVKKVIINNFSEFMIVFLYMLPSGLLSMVFIQKRSIYLLCNIYGVIFYSLYLILMFRSFQIKQTKVGLSALIIVLLSVLNVTITNVIHYGLQRYFVYTFGLMYIVLYIMILRRFEFFSRGK